MSNKKQIEQPPLNGCMAMDITIIPEQIDDRGHVNNTVHLSWIQQAALSHWKQLAGDRADQFAWVVRRHEIDYLAPILPGTDIIALTWVGETDAMSSIRRVRIQTRDGRILAEAMTIWCLIDPNTGRFRRITDDVKEILGK
jgi:acyl-CoA thioester hydrolase